MKLIAKILTVAVAALTLAAVNCSAQSTSTSTNAPAHPHGAKGVRFSGTVSKIGASQVTITTSKGDTEVIHFGSDVKYFKGGEPATSSDLKVGERVTGTYHKDEAGDLTTKRLNIGEPKKPAPDSSTK